MLYNDYALATSSGGGKCGWTLVYDSGFEEPDLDYLPGDVLVVGPCACEEIGDKLAQRYPHWHIYRVPEYNDLVSNTRYQARNT